MLNDRSVTQRPQATTRVKSSSWLLAAVDYCHRTYGDKSPLTKDATAAKDMQFARAYVDGSDPDYEGSEAASKIEAMLAVLHAAHRHEEDTGYTGRRSPSAF